MAYSEDSFKQEILEILEQLEVHCRRFELYKEKKKGKSGIEIEILVSDIKLTPIFKEIEHLYDVAQYLQNNGLDFFVTFNFDNSLSQYIDSEHPSEKDVQIGTIKGKDIKTIKEKIISLEEELGITKTEKALITDSNVFLDYETCVLKIGDTEIKFRPESRECQLLRIMSGQEPNQGLEWDQIGGKMEIFGEGKGKQETVRIIGDTRDRINVKIQKALHTSENLIERATNRYTASHKIRSQAGDK